MENMAEMPLSALPVLLSVMADPKDPTRKEALVWFCNLVSRSYGEDGEAVGDTVRAAGGIQTILWMLDDPSRDIQQKVLYLCASLASDAVDLNSEETKEIMRESGAEYRLLPFLYAEDKGLLFYACATLQNLCKDPEWSRTLLRHKVSP